MHNIMIVDDEPDNIELMKIILSKHGFNPITYTNPVEAFNTLKRGNLPDLLILDMRMPEMSGTDFCTELRKDPKFNNLKIAFFTASNDLNDDLLHKYNVLGFIYKPFNINELIAQINKYLAK
ncbi:MAG TPA: response regulator [Alphaproteobacteria bacterium]|nr:response regulator [Alphaproteobacteria bacterium]